MKGIENFKFHRSNDLYFSGIRRSGIFFWNKTFSRPTYRTVTPFYFNSFSCLISIHTVFRVIQNPKFLNENELSVQDKSTFGAFTINIVVLKIAVNFINYLSHFQFRPELIVFFLSFYFSFFFLLIFFKYLSEFQFMKVLICLIK